MSEQPSRNRWTPHRLPRIRRDLARAHDQAAAELRELARDGERQGRLTPELRAQFAALDDGRDLHQLAEQYRAAELYWVTPDMTRLALHSSEDIPEWTPAAARPSTFGLLVWDGGLPHLPWHGAPEKAWTRSPLGMRVPPTVPLDAMMWSPAPSGIRIGLLTRTDVLADVLVDRWHDTGLFAFGDIVLPLLDPAPTTAADWSSDWTPRMVAVVGATWLMMQQPTVVDVRPLDPHTGNGAPRQPRLDAEVRIVDLRRAVIAPRAPAGDGGRAFRHRWIVSGHWRQQACGPGRTQRRPVYVPSHVKGPDGAPMLDTDRVKVWRR